MYAFNQQVGTYYGKLARVVYYGRIVANTF
jgi:hypothetical protein